MIKNYKFLTKVAMLLLTFLIPLAGWGQTYEMTTSLVAGDEVVLVNTSVTKELGSLTTSGTTYGTAVDVANSTPVGSNLLTVVAGNTEGSFAFKTSNGKYLSWSSGNSLTSADEVTNASSWTITFDGEGNATVANVGTTARILSYNSGSPRFACYGNTNQQRVRFYKKESAASDAPSITASNVNIDYDVTGGEISYTINNGVDGGVLNASVTDGDWLTLSGTNFESPIAFTCEANDGAERTATVTLTYSYDNGQTVTKDVTVTQAAWVADYATLPFEWAGGASSDFEKLAGVMTDGLGSDYGANHDPYLMKFDTTGDYIQVKCDQQPGKVTIGVKMIGGANASSIKVQGSADGETFTDIQTLSISGAQNSILTLETTQPFAATDRFVRLEFTKGSNVGVGPITIAVVSSEPSIVVDPKEVSVDANENEGTLALAYENLDITAATDFDVVFYDAEGAEVQNGYEWLAVEVMALPTAADTYGVSYMVDANTATEERTAYFKVYALDGDANEVYSDMVTVTQAGYVEPFTPTTYSLATSITHGIHYIIVSSKEDGAAKAMGSQTSNNRASADVSISNGKATVNSADVYEFVISGPNADGFYTIHDENANSTGYLYAASSSSNQLKTQETNNANGMWSIEFDSETNAATIKAQGSNTRNLMRFNSSSNIFSCYGSGQQDIYLFAKDNDEPSSVLVTIREDFTATTFSCNKALDFTNADVTAQIITDEVGTTQTVTVVPAETGLYITGEPGIHEIPVADASAETDNVDSNKLKAVMEDSQFATQNSVTFYAFGKQKGKEAFYKIPTSGYNVPAGKAVLRITKANAPEMIVVNGGTTGVDSLELTVDSLDGDVFDLSGRKVSNGQIQKGIYIVGGRKVVVK